MAKDCWAKGGGMEGKGPKGREKDQKGGRDQIGKKRIRLKKSIPV
jgi:hypothetical protein